jgi:hypothetical protein
LTEQSHSDQIEKKSKKRKSTNEDAESAKKPKRGGKKLKVAEEEEQPEEGRPGLRKLMSWSLGTKKTKSKPNKEIPTIEG